MGRMYGGHTRALADSNWVHTTFLQNTVPDFETFRQLQPWQSPLYPASLLVEASLLMKWLMIQTKDSRQRHLLQCSLWRNCGNKLISSNWVKMNDGLFVCLKCFPKRKEKKIKMLIAWPHTEEKNRCVQSYMVRTEVLFLLPDKREII